LGIPTDSGRCHVTVETVQEHFQRLRQDIENVPVVFIFTADESGYPDFVDSREVQVIVPAAFPHDSVPIPSNRSAKRATMLTAVSTDGGCLKPMITIQRKTYAVHLCEPGLAPDTVMIVHRERCFINRALFDH
jgi:hypothetical protein